VGGRARTSIALLRGPAVGLQEGDDVSPKRSKPELAGQRQRGGVQERHHPAPLAGLKGPALKAVVGQQEVEDQVDCKGGQHAGKERHVLPALAAGAGTGPGVGGGSVDRKNHYPYGVEQGRQQGRHSHNVCGKVPAPAIQGDRGHGWRGVAVPAAVAAPSGSCSRSLLEGRGLCLAALCAWVQAATLFWRGCRVAGGELPSMGSTRLRSLTLQSPLAAVHEIGGSRAV
jgi:hypothetical protein